MDVLKKFEKFTDKHLPRGHLTLKHLFIKKKTPAQFFSCQFGKILKNTYSVEHIRVTAFGFPK